MSHEIATYFLIEKLDAISLCSNSERLSTSSCFNFIINHWTLAETGISYTEETSLLLL